MLGHNHLHIDKRDQVSDWVSKALLSAKTGAINIDFANEPAVRINVENDKINVDLLRADIFKVSEDETSLFDKLKTASEFGRKLSDNGITISFLRKGKEAIRLGIGANPSFLKLITKSDDVQLTNMREFSKLKSDLNTD